MSDRFFDAGTLVSVLTTQPIDRALDYRAPEGGCWSGAVVEVPLGPRKVPGIVWGPGEGDLDMSKVRTVLRTIDTPPMRTEMRAFLTRAAEYTLTPMPAMLRLALRAPGLGDPPSMRQVYRPGPGWPDRMTPAREKVLGVLSEYGGLAFTLRELAEMAGVGTSVVKGLVKQGAVLEEQAPRDRPYPPLDPDRAGPASDHRAGQRGPRVVRRRPVGRLRHHAAAGRDRIGQDRGLPRGGGRNAAHGPPGACPLARDRADGGIHRADGGPVRRPARPSGIRASP